MASRTVTTHADAIRMDVPDLVQTLIDALGASVVAAMSGAGSRSLPKKWVEGTRPGPEKLDRLRLGYRVWRTLSDAEGRHVALAWMVGANPRLEEQTPVTCIRELRTIDVLGAAEAFVNDNPA
ncbi:hypothetical protein [Sanguibacter suaedae]|jgi:hypothetical protein|uniref:Uncharacterized protein n=1 Tax=Sanguibacter suaedae TaxID=2795737 RepID=A0A934I5M6_9MICO|nr:hypothetical protein [Sanguibacter suaedae]MBI9115653.1 hypothetical protein [Sanguibacter suaedae]